MYLTEVNRSSPGKPDLRFKLDLARNHPSVAPRRLEQLARSTNSPWERRETPPDWLHPVAYQVHVRGIRLALVSAFLGQLLRLVLVVATLVVVAEEQEHRRQRRS